ncbi:MAG: DsbC family protein [Polaromonas sp.]|nr:DsbC family protein [Polaromonas sp.]
MNDFRLVSLSSRVRTSARFAALVAAAAFMGACQAQPASAPPPLKPIPKVPGASAPAPAPALPALAPAKKAELMALFDSKTGMKSTDANVSPVPGFFEIVVMANVFYMDAAGKHLFDGHLVDLDTRTSITAARKAALQATAFPALDWRSLDLNDAIKTSYGNATPGRVLVTFEDPNCGFCKKLHSELAKLKNLTVYTFPISFLGPQSQAINQSIWCAKDRGAEWAKALSGAPYTPVAAPAGCNTDALTRNGELARRLGVQGTPTMYLADGSRLPGYMSAEALEAKLSTQQNR